KTRLCQVFNGLLSNPRPLKPNACLPGSIPPRLGRRQSASRCRAWAIVQSISSRLSASLARPNASTTLSTLESALGWRTSKRRLLKVRWPCRLTSRACSWVTTCGAPSAAEGGCCVPAPQPGRQLEHHLRSAVVVPALEGTQFAERA